jgi:hypothetical protein
MPLAGVAGITFWLDAGEGELITGETGQIDIYIYDNDVWGVALLLTLGVPPGATGLRRVQLGTVQIDNPRGRMAPIANGISASGATIIIEALATNHGYLTPRAT